MEEYLNDQTLRFLRLSNEPQMFEIFKFPVNFHALR